MMTKLGVVAALAALGVLGCGVGLGQTPTQTDSQTLQAILVEMRGMHNDVRLSQSSQILLAEMLMQHAVVDKAMEKRDDARNRASQLQTNEKNFAAQIAQDEDNAKSMTLDEVRQKQLADQETMLKAQLANFKSQEQDLANAALDADAALRKEQDALDNIQAQLDAVVKQLQPSGK
jgi:hypothetical protein